MEEGRIGGREGDRKGRRERRRREEGKNGMEEDRTERKDIIS